VSPQLSLGEDVHTVVVRDAGRHTDEMGSRGCTKDRPAQVSFLIFT